MTMGQFVFGSLVVYSIIHLHRKHGFKWLKERFFLVVILVFASFYLLYLLIYLFSVLFN